MVSTDFIPLSLILQRVKVARENSDTDFFMSLMYAGEMMTKLVTLSMVSAVEDDPDRSRYCQLHRLVRADGLGEWVSVLEEVTSGPSSQHLCETARIEQQQLTQKLGPGSWQCEVVCMLERCLRVLDKDREGAQFKTEARRWFTLFSELRNRTRGHGAFSSSACSLMVPELEQSLDLFIDKFSLFKRDWAYLHRNLSGKYRVTPLRTDSKSFDELKTSRAGFSALNLVDGVYVWLNKPVLAHLIVSDPEVTDFYFPNGAFNGKRFELLSYISDSMQQGDAVPFMAPAGLLQRSETEGITSLEVQASTFGNLPSLPSGYVRRESLETELRKRLLDDRHPVITLVGKGGIGKTSLALNVLHRLEAGDRFGAIMWFSARDIDLLPEGPKVVRPHLLAETDIAREFVRLLAPSEAAEKGFKPLKYLGDALGKSPLGAPLLLVFDNFETVRSPSDLYSWIDNAIRLPNKILITTRSREFKGDYPVEVLGMSDAESNELITLHSSKLGISELIGEKYRKELIRESDGHPYVIKVLLGEVAKAGRTDKIERIVANKEEILDALFERTYSTLSPSAKQIFLTLCNWRSTIPQLALEAVILREANERIDVGQAIEELQRSSFVDTAVSEQDKEVFVTVPLVASIFGRRKLSASPMKSAVEANTELLLYFGAGQKSDVARGIGPRIQRLFANVSEIISKSPERLPEYLPTLEFVAQRHPAAWLLLAALHGETSTAGSLDSAKECLRRYLERESDPTKKKSAWEWVALLCRRSADPVGELHARIEMCSLPDVPFEQISEVVNRWNIVFKQQFLGIADDERQILGRRLLALARRNFDGQRATDCSRIAWLALNLHDSRTAREFTQRGLRIDPQNEHCLNLAETLRIQPELVPLDNVISGSSEN